MADPDEVKLSTLSKRLLSTPHKPREEYIVKDKVKSDEKPPIDRKTRPASKGRVHKGRTSS